MSRDAVPNLGKIEKLENYTKLFKGVSTKIYSIEKGVECKNLLYRVKGEELKMYRPEGQSFGLKQSFRHCVAHYKAIRELSLEFLRDC